MTLAVLELSARRLLIQEGELGPTEILEFSATLSKAGHITLGLPQGLSRIGDLCVSARTDAKKKAKPKNNTATGKLKWNGDWMHLELALRSTFSVNLSLPPERFHLLVQESRTAKIEVRIDIHALESIAVYENDSERGYVEWDVDREPELQIDSFSFHCSEKMNTTRTKRPQQTS